MSGGLEARLPVVVAMLSALMTLGCAVVVAQRARRAPAARWIVAMQLVEFVWSLGFVLETLSPSLGGRVLWDDVQLVVAMMLPTISLGLASEFAERPLRHPRVAHVLAAALPITATLFVLSDPLHHLARGAARLVTRGVHVVLDYPFGELERAAYVATVIVTTYAIFVVLSSIRGESRAHTTQALALAVWLVVPHLSVVMLILHVYLLGQRDPGPFWFGIASLVGTWALLRGRLFDLVPIARAKLFEETREPVVVVDDAGRILEANPAARTVLGDVVVGSEIAGLAGGGLVPFTKEGGPTLADVALGDTTFAVHATRVPASGPPRGVVLRLDDVTVARRTEAHLRDGHERLARAVESRTRDLHDTSVALVQENAQRRAAESVARTTERKLAAVFEHAEVPLLVLSPSGMIQATNRAAERLLGGAEEAHGSLTTRLPWCESARYALSAAVIAAAEGRAERVEASLGDGADERVFEIAMRPSPGEIEGSTLVLVECHEVTARVRAERDRALMEARVHQTARLESLGRVASAVAHDFNNLLQIIGMSTALAVRSEAEGRRTKPALDEIEKAVESGRALAKQLLSLSREGAPRVLDVDVGDSVRELEPLLSRALGPTSHLTLDVAPGSHVVRIDPSRLEQILLNLVVNARDAMPRGGTLGVRVSSTERLVTIAVSDEGVGIAPELLSRIFEPFFTTKSEGSGLGLATVYGATREGQGTIEVESKVGEGTTFRIGFPTVRTSRDRIVGQA